MFQRQARQPFPIRNIIVLALIVLGFFLFLLNQIKKTPNEPTSPPVEQSR